MKSGEERVRHSVARRLIRVENEAAQFAANRFTPENKGRLKAAIDRGDEIKIEVTLSPVPKVSGFIVTNGQSRLMFELKSIANAHHAG